MVAVVAGIALGPQQVVGDELADGAAGLESRLVVEGPVDAAVDPAGARFLRRVPEAVEGPSDDLPAGRDLGRRRERDGVVPEELRQYGGGRRTERAVGRHV